MSEVLEVILRVQDGASAPIRAAGQAAAKAAPEVTTMQRSLTGLVTAGGETSKQLLGLKLVLAERLAPALSMISPEIGAAAAGLGRFASAASLLGGAALPLAGILAPIAAGLGIVYAVAKDSAEQTAALAAKIKKLNEEVVPEKIRAYTSAWADFNAIAEDVNLQLAVLEGSLTAEEAATIKRVEKIREEAEARRVANEQAKEEVRQELLALDALARRRDLTAAEKATMAEKETLLESLREEGRSLADNTAQTIENANKIGDLTARKKDAAAAARDHANALREEQAAGEGKLSIPQAPLQTDNAGTGATALYWSEWQAKQRRAAGSASAAASGGSSSAFGIGMAQAFIGGDFNTIIASMGGPAAIAATAVQALEQLGDIGAAGVQAQATDYLKNIAAGIGELPALLAEALPGALETFTREVPKAIIDALPGIIWASIQMQFELVKELFLDLPIAWGRAILNALKEWTDSLISKIADVFGIGKQWDKAKDWISNAWDTVKGWGKSAWEATGGKVFDEGAQFVDHTQLALVHHGEEIVPEGGRSQRGARRGMGNVYIQISGHVGPEALAELDRQMRAYSGLGYTFGT